MGKRNRIVLFSSLAIAMIIALYVCISAMQVTATSLNYTTIVIDAGHGGIDSGVVGVKTKVKESDVNLQISWKLHTLITDAGLNAVMTRKTEAGLYGVATKGFKKRDMLERKTTIEENAPVAVISIHQNKYSNQSRRGGQAFYKIGSEQSKTLAENIQGELNGLYADLKDYDTLQGDYYILNCTEYPSVIVECGFLSNPIDEQNLIDDIFQQKVAESIFKGLVTYLSKSTINLKYKE